MEEVKNLIKRLINHTPSYVNDGCFDNCTLVYNYNNIEYAITPNHYDKDAYSVSLDIREIDDFRWINNFNIDLSEKEYMEIKWKIEDWEKCLEEKQISDFKDFVESFSDSSMNDLLND